MNGLGFVAAVELLETERLKRQGFYASFASLHLIPEWHAHTDGCPTSGPRLDGHLASEQVEPLPHADEPQPVAFALELWINPGSPVRHLQVNLRRRSAQRHPEVPHTSMSDRVAQRFLQHPEQTERNVLR